MRGLLRTALIAAAALAAASATFVGLTVPPRARQFGGRVPGTYVTGVYHVHTARSDGTGSVDDVAAAAARAGVAFVVFTDHGDATRPPDPPTYRHGVLCLDAVEIGTDAGHLVALGLSGPAPYPFAGRAEDVIEDIHRLGGIAIAAHPDSPKPALRWRSQSAGVDGIEWLNADSEWRDESPRHLLASAARALVRGPETVASLFSRPARTLQRWDAAARTRAVFGIAAVDAHARLGWDDDEPRQRTLVAWPSYETLFRTLAQTVILDRPLTGDAHTDGAAVITALATGRSFSVVRAFADVQALEFTAERDGIRAAMGDRLPVGEAATFRANLPHAPDARLLLLHDGKPVASAHGEISWTAPPETLGVYRVEAFLPERPTPWLVSNLIVVGDRGERPAPEASQDASSFTGELIRLPVAGSWAIERDPLSTGAMTADGESLRFDYRLAPGTPRGQYVALAGGVEADAGVDRVQFAARASRPMRLSLQLRLPNGRDPQRWRRSIYLDQTPRQVVVRMREFEPVDGNTSRRPVVIPLQSVLFVVDTLNASPGTSGSVWLSDIALGIGRP